MRFNFKTVAAICVGVAIAAFLAGYRVGMRELSAMASIDRQSLAAGIESPSDRFDQSDGDASAQLSDEGFLVAASDTLPIAASETTPKQMESSRQFFPDSLVHEEPLFVLPRDDIQESPGGVARVAEHEVAVDAPESNEDVLAQPTIAAATPETLSPPENALPIEQKPSLDKSAILSIIQQQLPGATKEEREIWFNELRNLPPEMVREILQLRRQFGSDQPTSPRHPGDSSLPNEPAIADQGSRPRSVRQYPAMVDDPESLARIERTVASLLLARDVISTNLANAQTIGFKRSRPLNAGLAPPSFEVAEIAEPIGHEPRQQAPFERHAAVPRAQIDFAPGTIRKTDRQLDVAIDGSGFLQVRQGESVYFTRAGILTLDADRNIALHAAGEPLPLEPQIRIEGSVVEIQIARDGTVSVRHAKSNDRQTVGRLQLARFINPSDLARSGQQLFAPTPSSGGPIMATPASDGLGAVLQGHLEESNVDLRDETARLQKLKSQLTAILGGLSIIDR